MEFIKLNRLPMPSVSYSNTNASSIEMCILGYFLISDADDATSEYKKCALNDELKYACGNITALKKEDNYVILSDLYSEEENPTELKIRKNQFIKLLDDWEEKVCKLKPKEIVIKHENDQFIIETKN